MKLVIALDMPSLKENLALLDKIKDLENNLANIWVKVGLRSFIRDGNGIFDSIRQIAPFKVFLDLKLYDIPNTMADSAYECAKLKVDMITIHTSAGERAMRAVMQRLESLPKRPLVMGVSALTSFDEAEFSVIYHTSIIQGVQNLAHIAKLSGIDGMVCSVQESAMIKNLNSATFLTLTPGIRPFGKINDKTDDQKRIATIQDAKNAQSDFIVIGRPIYKSKNPKDTISLILKEIECTK